MGDYFNQIAQQIGQGAQSGAAAAQAAAAQAAAAAPQPKPKRSFGQALQEIFAGSALGTILGAPQQQEAQIIVQDTAQAQSYDYNGLALIAGAAVAAWFILKK